VSLRLKAAILISDMDMRMYQLEPAETELSGIRIAAFRRRFSGMGIDLKALDEVLGFHKLGIDPTCNATPLNLEEFEYETDPDVNQTYEVTLVNRVTAFETISRGFQGLCALLWRATYDSGNILDEAKGADGKYELTFPILPADRHLDADPEIVRRLALPLCKAILNLPKAERLPRSLDEVQEWYNAAQPSSKPFLPWEDAKQQFGREYFHEVLNRAGGNKTAAARMAGASPNTLAKYLKQITQKSE
jgi:hypothetical protein